MTTERVARLAEFAALPLSADRAAVVAVTLGAWLHDANELSAKMSAPAHLALLPATVFTHGSCLGEETPA
ncbi:hypothetical protein [Variovorax sp. PBS-H4]|uniref:hypothetical protein n=1 Tax=Variovorax sp. PBS-H4 TaxID=434008 RepID=UPI0013A58C4B|nr:hypothetical protein [Variovorax sp. PBS-H4]